MRILHISSVYPPHVMGGAEKVVEMLAEAQVERGHAVGAAYLAREAEPAGIRHGVVVLPQANSNLLWMQDVHTAPRVMRTANKLGQMINVRAARDFAAAIAAFGPDVVHTHSMVELPPMIWREVAAWGARVVHTLHDYDLICSRATRYRDGALCAGQCTSCRVTGGWKAHFANMIDAVAAVSTPVLEEHRRFGLFKHLTGDRAQVIWNAANVAPIRWRGPREGPLTFGYLGRLVPEKGVLTLLDACRGLPEGSWRLRVAGRSPDGDQIYRDRAKGLPVEFLGFTDPAKFLQSVDVLVVPSTWREPFGLTVIEAFAQGVPVIGSEIGGITELVGAIGREWLVPPGDVAALHARLAAVIAMGRSALPPPRRFAAILARAAPDRMTDAYDALYEAAAAGRRAA